MIDLPLAHINVFFVLDGTKYEAEKFNIEFLQQGDYKGQPQHEVRGGQFVVTLTQLPDDNLHLWAKKSTLLKEGQVLFQTDMGISLMTLAFFDAYFVNLSTEISSFNGAKTVLIVSPKKVVIDGIEHENYWGLK
ncbi:MAG: hypothetical protein RL662_1751 [Bacteroidota bacterium]